VPGLLLKRRIGLIAVGLGFIASSCGLIGVVSGAGADTPQDKPTPTTTAGHSSTTLWNGNGTSDGFCGGFSEGLTGVPPGDEGWLFVLTSPDPGPWELTAKFAHSGTLLAAGTQNGNGSVHFVVFTSAGDQLLSASSTNGGHNLVVSGCTLGPKTGPYGPTTGGSTVTPATVEPSTPVIAPSSVTPPFHTSGPTSTAFTGAELALMITIGAIAIGVGGMLVLGSRRRRRSEPAYGSERR
jgi:hypothetical protein